MKKSESCSQPHRAGRLRTIRKSREGGGEGKEDQPEISYMAAGSRCAVIMHMVPIHAPNDACHLTIPQNIQTKGLICKSPQDDISV